MTDLRILVTGSRDWPKERATEIRDAIYEAVFNRDPSESRPVTIVHGAARGADAWADLTAVRMGYAPERHPAQWDRHGKSAGMRRNREMVALGADVVLAFPLGKSVGTRGCIKEAERAGLPVEVFEGLLDGLYAVVDDEHGICAGLTVKNGQVSEAAPILRRRLDWWISGPYLRRVG